MESLSYAFEGKDLLSTDDKDFLQFDDGNRSSVVSNLDSLMEFSTSFSGDDKLLAPSTGPNGTTQLSLAKRARVQPTQIPTCQVHGCNKDLSLSKDYHKRHKVCDIHSKTSVVVVNGIRQRFCQQCSRFHVLLEFDEGKRSCRKRLAGHNQRRRKPQFNPHDHLGSATSLLLSGLLPGGFLNLKSNELSFFKQENDPSPQISKPYSTGSYCSHALSLLSVQSHDSSSKSTAQTPLIAPQDSTGQNVSHCTNTVDLVQLSLHLRRVEQQKNYTGKIKAETGFLLPEL